jgi:hypothetical protein
MVRAFDIAHAATMAVVAFILLLIFSGTGGLGVALLGTLAAVVATAIAGFVCRWWPGLAAAWWRLWLAAWLCNPLVSLGVVYIVSQHECLLGQQRGWSCMGLALAVMAMPLTLIAPTVAVIAHVIARRREVTSD